MVGIDLESFINLQDGKSFRMKYNIRGKMILYVGRIYSCQKGLNNLINAISIILNKDPFYNFSKYLKLVMNEL
jgi:glycosyltransferase involved in cell wall biosynthesis